MNYLFYITDYNGLNMENKIRKKPDPKSEKRMKRTYNMMIDFMKEYVETNKIYNIINKTTNKPEDDYFPISVLHGTNDIKESSSFKEQLIYILSVFYKTFSKDIEKKKQIDKWTDQIFNLNL